jgi:hypothetical protein
LDWRALVKYRQCRILKREIGGAPTGAVVTAIFDGMNNK